MTSETSPLLINKESKASFLHYLGMISVTLAKLGESVELTLPAVITQQVSCELNLSDDREHVLALAQYASSAVVSIVTVPFLQRFPRKPIILFSLYLSVASVIFCAAVPNYISLLLSRILIGISIASSLAPLNVYISEVSPNEDFYVLATLVTSIGWATGGGWCGMLGYLFLEQVGWRIFVLLTSLPLFILPIVAFQFYLPESILPSKKCANDVQEPEKLATSKNAMIARIAKVILLNSFFNLPYYGSILLVPAVLKEDNTRNNRNSPCKAMYGAQFLTLSLLFGVSHIVGKALGYFIKRFKVSTPITLTVESLVTTGALAATLRFHNDPFQLFLWLSVVQVAVTAVFIELAVLSRDANFFDPNFLPISIGLQEGSDFFIGIVGNSISELLPYTMALKIFLASGVGMVLSSLLFFMKE